jgi:protein SCO1/2
MKAAGRAAISTVGATLCAAVIALTAAACNHPDEHGSFPSASRSDGLPAVTLVDQYGRPVSLPSLKGKPALVDFIYTNCTQSCPMLTHKMSEVARLLGPELGSKVRIVSFTVDPEHDHPQELLAYAKSHSADAPGWLFLTGPPAEIEKVMAAYNLKRAREPDGSIMHVTEAFLLDADGRQHRLYDGLEVKPSTVVGDIARARSNG